jgi:hypothetical protein
VARTTSAALLVASLLATVGCTSRPRAPALRDGPVYQNSQEGIRFSVPEGWTQDGQAQTPPGRLAQEVMLVEYKLLNAEQPAVLRVTLIDLPESTDIETYLRRALPSSEGWRQAEPPEAIEGQGKPGMRLVFTQDQGKERTTREITALRRRERVYFVTGIFGSSDTNTGQQIRRAVSSIEWKG